VDFEESSASAVAAAGVLAGMFGATLTAVHAHALEMPAYFTGAQMETLEAERAEGHARAAADLQTFAARHTNVPVRSIVEEGTPAAVILRMASAFNLIVLGTRRLRGPRRWWLGSVAEAVVRQVAVPVLVVPAAVSSTRVLNAGARIVAAGPDTARVDAWLAAFGDAMKGHIVRAGEIARCAPDRLLDADLVVVALPPGFTTGSQFDTIVQVLKECSRPVLFVPAAEAAVQGSSP
jgi:nucleotide-binding universal stress UspA family protein